MKKYLKLVSALMAVVAVIMMFFTQVTVEWISGAKEVIGVSALVGGKFPHLGTTINGVGSGLAGYILVGVAALILLAAALVPYFNEHDILAAVVTGLAVILLIIGVIFLFLIRKNFASANGIANGAKVYVGWAAITAGCLGSVSALLGSIGVVMDVANS